MMSDRGILTIATFGIHGKRGQHDTGYVFLFSTHTQLSRLGSFLHLITEMITTWVDYDNDTSFLISWYLISPAVYWTSASENDAACMIWPILRLSYRKKKWYRTRSNGWERESYVIHSEYRVMIHTSSIRWVIVRKRLVSASALRFKSEWPVWAPLRRDFMVVNALYMTHTRRSIRHVICRSLFVDGAYMRVGKMLMRWLLPDIVETRWRFYERENVCGCGWVCEERETSKQ